MNWLKRNSPVLVLLFLMASSLTWCVKIGMDMGTPEARARYAYAEQQDEARYNAELARLEQQ